MRRLGRYLANESAINLRLREAENGERLKFNQLYVKASTIADSISVGLPRDGVRAVRAASHTSGAYLTVTDDEILDAMRVLARRAAVFAEPAGATAYAGLVKAVQRGMVRHDETVVVLITGNGLKDIKSAINAAGHAQRIEPNLDDLKRWWNKVTTRAV